ncbi:cell division cycle protein 20 homolog B-like [Ptychodera flava]|uniref:cell division cycle protein 20 homolog B-like n=1 Tax=Ptychodera flava TaxID=63121 RepID=UPI00396A124B
MDDDFDILNSPAHAPRPAMLQRRRSSGGCDRFIPTRSNVDFDLAHFQLNTRLSTDLSFGRSPSLELEDETPENLRRRLNERRGSNSDTNKLLNFSDVRTQTNWSNANVADINCFDFAAVSAAGLVYVCSSLDEASATGEIDLDDVFQCCAWSPDGEKLAIGTSSSGIKVYDVRTLETIRTINYPTSEHDRSALAVSWSNNTICAGSNLGDVTIFDTRNPDSDSLTLQCDKNGRPSPLGQITTLKYSPDFCYVACGDIHGNLAIWDCNNNNEAVAKKKVAVNFPFVRGVRDISWHPIQTNLLAAGVSSMDDKGSIIMWNASLGLRKKDFTVESGVQSLAWSKVNNELLSGHGEPEKCVTVWKYPTMKKVFQYTGHIESVRQVLTNVDNSLIYSFTDDETIRIWKYPRVVTKSRSRSIAEAMAMRSPPSPLSMGLTSSIR